MKHLWCNGQWLDFQDFPMTPTDRGLTLGLGLFETILAMEGRTVFADRHLARLQGGCERLGWSFGYASIVETMGELLQRNQLAAGRARVRLAISAGSGVLRDLASGGDHVVWMTAAPVAEPPMSVTANLSPWRRNEHSALAGLKCASYAENLVALDHARRLGFEETVFLNTAGHVCEAATANVFVVKNGGLQTPPVESGCLPGVTRAAVIGLARELGITCHERDVTPGDLHAADELFLTSSLRGVTAVSRFGETSMAPGALSGLLRQAWNAEIIGKKAT